MHVNHHCIHADIKISSAPGNLLRLVNGITVLLSILRSLAKLTDIENVPLLYGN